MSTDFFNRHEPSWGLNLFESVGVDYDSVYDLTELADRINNIAEEMNADFEVEFDSKLQSFATKDKPTHISDCIKLAKDAAEEVVKEHHREDKVDIEKEASSSHKITDATDWFSKLEFDSDSLEEINLLAYQLDDVLCSVEDKYEQEFRQRLSESHPRFSGYAIAETIKEVAVDFLNEKELGFEIEASQNRKEGIVADGYPLENEGDFSSTVSYYEEQQEKQENSRNSQEQPEQG